MLNIGVLALQGAVKEHIRLLKKLQVTPVPVKKVEHLHGLGGLIIPGGESTTIGRLIQKYGFKQPLLDKINAGFPVWGTCAGLIVLAERISGSDQERLGAMQITVARNAFGRQRDSFETSLTIEGVADDFEAVFIRAPLVSEVSEDVRILSTYRDEIVAVQQGSLLACSFHPELTGDDRFHRYFVQTVEYYLQQQT